MLSPSVVCGSDPARRKRRKETKAQSHSIFESRFAGDLFSAILKSGAIPGFSHRCWPDVSWHISRGGSVLKTFNSSSAQTAVQREGCYLFVGAPDDTRGPRVPEPRRVAVISRLNNCG